MRSPVTLRLDDSTRVRIARIARRRGITASEVIRQAIASWADADEMKVSPFEAVSDLLGIVHGGDRHRSAQTGRQLKHLLERRRRRP